MSLGTGIDLKNKHNISSPPESVILQWNEGFRNLITLHLLRGLKQKESPTGQELKIERMLMARSRNHLHKDWFQNSGD